LTSAPTIRPSVVATFDDRSRAIVDEVTPLRYRAGASPSDDLPAHVRAASAIRRWGTRMVIVQDDVNALAVRDERSEVSALLLPRGPGDRRIFDDDLGNKHHKLDLEACVVLPDARVVAFGSGSTSARETIVIVDAAEHVELFDASALYARLRALPAFSGSELNIEGAVVLGDELLLFQRGNGAPRGGLEPVNAIGAFELTSFLRWLDGHGSCPFPSWIMQVELPRSSGVRLSFTDAAVTSDGRVVVLTCAEDSPDAVRDGPILGCSVGLLEDGKLRLIDVLDEQGQPCLLKLEGIEQRPGTELVFDVVADMDRPSEAARIARLRLLDRT
jgi:hypothetical protein